MVASKVQRFEGRPLTVIQTFNIIYFVSFFHRVNSILLPVAAVAVVVAIAGYKYFHGNN